jgi:hypothetical protein
MRTTSSRCRAMPTCCATGTRRRGVTADAPSGSSRQMAQEGTGARLAVDRVSDGAFIGWCSLNRWNPDYCSASLGYCFDDAAWGHGYATEATRCLLLWAFDTLDLNLVHRGRNQTAPASRDDRRRPDQDSVLVIVGKSVPPSPRQTASLAAVPPPAGPDHPWPDSRRSGRAGGCVPNGDSAGRARVSRATAAAPASAATRRRRGSGRRTPSTSQWVAHAQPTGDVENVTPGPPG